MQIELLLNYMKIFLMFFISDKKDKTRLINTKKINLMLMNDCSVIIEFNSIFFNKKKMFIWKNVLF